MSSSFSGMHNSWSKHTFFCWHILMLHHTRVSWSSLGLHCKWWEFSCSNDMFLSRWRLKSSIALGVCLFGGCCCLNLEDHWKQKFSLFPLLCRFPKHKTILEGISEAHRGFAPQCWEIKNRWDSLLLLHLPSVQKTRQSGLRGAQMPCF